MSAYMVMFHPNNSLQYCYDKEAAPVRDNWWWLDNHDGRCVPGSIRTPRAAAHCRAVRKCVLNAPCEKERCKVVRASKVYHPMALKTCVE